MISKNPIFEKNYHDYLRDLSRIDLSEVSAILDIAVESDNKTAVI